MRIKRVKTNQFTQRFPFTDHSSISVTWIEVEMPGYSASVFAGHLPFVIKGKLLKAVQHLRD